MFCKKCGKELENNVAYCPNCGEVNNDEESCLKRERIDIKKNLIQNVYKIALAVISIATFFLPWINLIGVPINIFEANKVVGTVDKLMDGVLGIFGGELESISKILNLDVNRVMTIFEIAWKNGNEGAVLLQSSKWILFVIAVIILLNIFYIIFLILGKEKNWMMVSLVLMHVTFSAAIILMIVVMKSEIIELSYGAVVLFVVQGVFGELAAQKEVVTHKNESFK